ncbi:hypothetical protein EMCRGX_G004611 [Ephydatia muelleri]
MATTTKPYKLFHVPTHGEYGHNYKALQAVPCTHPQGGVYLRQPGTQRHARIRNTGGVTTTTKYLNTGLARSMATTTKPYKLFHVPTHRVGVYLRQPGTQRHARIRNTGGVTTTTKYLKAHQWRWVPFSVGVYLRQPGTQRHARIWNTGGVTTTNTGRCVPVPTKDPTSRADPEHWGCDHKYLQADQWRWVPFLVGVYLRQPRTQRHAWIWNTGGVTTTNKYLQADQWRWVPFLVGVYLCQPGTQRHARFRNTGGVTTTH